MCSSAVFAEGDSLKEVTIDYYHVKVKLSWNTNQFFTGSIKVEKNGEIVFSDDSTFSDYADHKLIDLDGDKSKELVLIVTEGASPYIYNNMIIFDGLMRGYAPRFRVQNADIVEKENELPKILAYTRMSPSVLGLGYHWLLEYKQGKLNCFTAKGTLWQKDVTPDIKGTEENLKQYEDAGFTCEDSNYLTFFESVLMQGQISGDITEALDFFKKRFNCASTANSTAMVELQKRIDQVYFWINDHKNYLYSNE